NTIGIFQLESGGMTRFMKDLGPTCPEDLIAGISLYRPGPMDSIPKYIECKKNPKKVKYLVPQLEPILSPTYGCIVYQEQVMDIVRALGGYSYGRADLVRRAMSKKKADVMAKEREYFVNGKLNEDGSVDVPGCIRNGIPEKEANIIFDDMTSFAAYAFNKSHAAAYAVVAYQTAWLKTYYPVQFMASLMTYPAGNDAVAGLIRNAGDMGIKVLPPDVNRSQKHFDSENGCIRYGLLGIKHVGEGMVDEIIRARNVRMPSDIFEFVDGLDVHQINRQAMEALIKACALDCFPGNKAQKLSTIGDLIESAQSTARNTLDGQISLFSMDGPHSGISIKRTMPPMTEFRREDLMSMEKEMLGIYLTDHPLNDVKEQILSIIDMDTATLADPEKNGEIEDGRNVTMAGLITGVKKLVTKKGTQMAFLTVEDLYGQIEVVVFPKYFEECRQNIEEDAVVVMRGRLDLKDEARPKLLASSVQRLDQVFIKTAMVKIVIPESYTEPEGLARFKSIAKQHLGDMPVAILVQSTGKKYKLDYDLWVDPCREFYDKVHEAFGPDCLR
ncbi:MAG: DNA polymerase III subunit alpha, partial [Firmicutes bacterium]|nr:DNA polymerase III subunit alpha [Bacillota bacterium]